MANTALIGVGVAVAGMAVASVKAASDLEESMNKVKVVFGDSADQIVAWSEDTATSMGISQQAALESAGTFGNLFDAMGLATKAGASMSTTLVGLAADLASFNNASPEDVLQALQSGLTGQIRPLRQFGIEISEAAIQQEALAQGIKKSTSEMTLAEKVQLRYALIMKQTGNAQGDFQRTAGGLANQQRIMAAQWEDLQATLGEALLPAVIAVVGAFNDLLTVLLFLSGQIKDFSDQVKEAGINFGEFELKIADFFTKLTGGIPIIGDAIKAVDEWNHRNDSTVITFDQAVAAYKRGEIALLHWLGVTDKAGRTAADFADKLSKVGKDIREGIVSEIPAIIGSVTKVKDAFDITPKELQTIAHHWATIARTIGHDLRVIANSDISPSMREAISALPPEMRHAWVEGNARQRQSIQDSLKTTYDVQGSMSRLARDALTGGTGVGHSVDQGIVRGIESGIPAITAAARNAVQKAIDAARDQADAQSPSKKMMELGKDMIQGLVEGMESDAQKAVDAATNLLQRVMDAASSFKGAISGGFSGFGQISGAFGTAEAPPTAAGIDAFISQQVGAASQFASILKALKAQGASKGLLTQVAAGGAEAVPFAQALLQGGPALIKDVSDSLSTIAGLASETSERLTKSFFGDRIDRLKDRVTEARDSLRNIEVDLRLLDRMDQGVHIVINGDVTGQDLVDKIEAELVKRLDRHGAVLNGAVKQP